MSSQLLPHPDLGPALHPHLSAEQRIELWIDLMHFGDSLFEAGALRNAKGEAGVREAWKASYERYRKEQDRKLLAMATRFGEFNGR